MLTHAAANQILRDEWTKVWGRPATDAEIMFIQAVAWLETNYGRAGQFASWPDDGDYNWANLEKTPDADGTCPVGWRLGKDGGNDRCFRVFASDNEAANALIKNLTKRHWPTVEAIASEGTAEAMAHAMKAAPAYYEASELAYASALKNAINAFGLPQPPQPSRIIPPSKTRESSGWWWKLPSLAYGTYRLAKWARKS